MDNNGKQDRWVELYEKYAEEVLHPSNIYLPPVASEKDEPETSEK